LILIFVTLEGTLGTFQGPIYNSILGDIIDEDKRGDFLGKRNRMVNFMGFVSTIVAGIVLSYFKGFDTNGTAHYVFFGFGILFFFAFISRLLSSFYKRKMYCPPYTPKKSDVTFWNFMKNMTHDNYGIFVMYVFLFQMAANVSAPFFALYLLRDMQFSYLYFTLISGISILTSFVAMGYWGKLIDKRGSKFVLRLAGFLVPFSPFLLVCAIFIKTPMALFIYILCEEAFSGIVWAGFNLSTSSFLFDATNKDERVKYISYYNLLIGIAVFLGAMLGSVLLKIYPSITMTATLVVTAIPIIYITTGLLRLTVTILFMKKVHEARMVEVDFPGRGFFHRVIAINPRSHNQVMIMSTYENSDSSSFHELIPVKKKIKGGNEKKPEKKSVGRKNLSEKEVYEKKSVEYYRQNAMKTMDQKQKQETQKDDSDKIEKNIETDRKKIQDMVESMKKEK
jgi:MFS family permease